MLRLAAVFVCAHEVASQCVRWRQTRGCNPDGVRMPEADKSCGATITKYSSGYCECSRDVVVKKSGCCSGDCNGPSDRSFRCADECNNANKNQCDANGKCEEKGTGRKEDGIEMVDITVPRGAKVGMGFTIRGSNGVKIRAVVPPGYTEGMVFQVKVPSQANEKSADKRQGYAQEKKQGDKSMIDITVPNGARPGMGFTITGSNGIKIRAVVPPGYTEGMVFQVPVPKTAKTKEPQIPQTDTRTNANSNEDSNEIDLNKEWGLYAALGLDQEGMRYEADDTTIKKAYRKKSLRWHPDKAKAGGGSSPSVADLTRRKRNFEQVLQAYEVLGNADLRFLYNTGGREKVAEYQAAAKRSPHHLRSFQGQGFVSKLQVTLAQLYSGAKRTIDMNRRVVCLGCKVGTAAMRTSRCRSCEACPPESQIVLKTQRHGRQTIHRRVRTQVPSQYRCRKEKKRLEVVVEKGMTNNANIVFEREGGQMPGVVPGKVVIVLEPRPHSTFTRHNVHDLHATMVITLKEALIGFEKSIAHLDGSRIPVVKDGSRPTPPHSSMVLKGQGMPKYGTPSEYGDLTIQFEVTFPNAASLSEEARTDIQKLFP